MLPYSQLFGPNVLGTAELIRLAITTKLKPVHYISTMGVAAVADHIVDENSDIRTSVPVCTVGDGYANGYGIGKWASEVLMREAHDLCDLPIAVFRPGMILAHSRYAGQLNVPDIFTRLIFSSWPQERRRRRSTAAAAVVPTTKGCRSTFSPR